MFRFLLQLAAVCQIIFALALFAPAWAQQAAHKTQASHTESKPEWSAEWEPTKLVNGSPVIFRVTAPRELKEIKGSFLGQELLFRSSASCHCWYAFAGVSLTTKPGTYTLHVEGKSYLVAVAAAAYPSTTLKVAPEFVEPPKETLARIEEDQATKKSIFASVSALEAQHWSGRFQPPAEAEVSGVFGSARVFNGVKKSQHEGLDFRVTTGTPVAATSNGTVLLARPLYFEGNCVMIDHGQGLITLYLHLSEFKVKEGDAVEKGQIVGLSGGTGRATAPHLHFAVRWRGEYLDPRTLLELRPPGN